MIILRRTKFPGGIEPDACMASVARNGAHVEYATAMARWVDFAEESDSLHHTGIDERSQRNYCRVFVLVS